MNTSAVKDTNTSTVKDTEKNTNEAKLLIDSISAETIDAKVNRLADNVINKIYAKDYAKVFTVETIYVDNKPTYMFSALMCDDDGEFYGTIISDLITCQLPKPVFTESECLAYIKENIHNTDVTMLNAREEYFLGTGFTAKHLDVSIKVPGKDVKIAFTLSNQFKANEFFHRRIAKLEKLVEDLFKVICQLQIEANNKVK